MIYVIKYRKTLIIVGPKRKKEKNFNDSII